MKDGGLRSYALHDCRGKMLHFRNGAQGREAMGIFAALGDAVRSRRLAVALVAVVLASGLRPAVAETAAGCDRVSKPPPLATSRPLNLGRLKLELTYYRCTRYDSEVAKVLHDARVWIERRTAHVDNSDKLALVLDIDETSLSNWKLIHQNDFGYIVQGGCDFSKGSACGQIAWERSASAEAIKPTLDLFKAAKARHVAVFFVTGRHEDPDERTATETNLRKAGYEGWQRLSMRTNDFDGPSVAPFKTWARREIERQGYTIIANVGDQLSDLANGHAERRFKVPNPFYFIQ